MTQFQQDLVKLIVDRLLIGIILAVLAFYFARILETHRANVSQRQVIALQRGEACRTLMAMLAEFQAGYLDWLEELETLLKHLEAGSHTATEIETTLSHWNNVNAHIKRSDFLALLPFVPTALQGAVSEYFTVADGFPSILRAGPDAARSLGSGEPLRESLGASYAILLATYAQILAHGFPL